MSRNNSDLGQVQRSHDSKKILIKPITNKPQHLLANILLNKHLPEHFNKMITDNRYDFVDFIRQIQNITVAPPAEASSDRMSNFSRNMSMGARQHSVLTDGQRKVRQASYSNLMKIENKVPSVEPQVVDALDAIQPITLKEPP